MIKHRILIQDTPMLEESSNDDLLAHSQGLVISYDEKLPEGMECAAVCAKSLNDLNNVPENAYRVLTDPCGLHVDDSLVDKTRLIIKVEVARPKPSYSLNRSQHGSGFAFFAPDPQTILGFQVPIIGIGLSQWLMQLDRTQVHGVWLDCPEAENERKGLELDMLATARQHFSGEIWLSGGAREFRHIQNLVQEGNCDALVLSMNQFDRLGGRAVVNEMNPPERIPVSNLESEPSASVKV